jgi:hypothetical protein
MAEPCDSIGSPASHQQLVVVQAIVHTDNGPNNKVVKIPPYVPVFLHRDSNGDVMQTDGIAHIGLDGRPIDFFGISTEMFVAHHSRGETSNHMPVAISGLVTVATPNAKFNIRGGEPRFGTGALVSPVGENMNYEDQLCVSVVSSNRRPIAANVHIGRYVRHLDRSYDGIAVILKGKPHEVSIADTAGALDDGPAEPAPVRAPVRAAVPTSYAMTDSDDEPAVGGKRKSPAPTPADGTAGAGGGKRKKKGSRKKTGAAAPPAEAGGTV